MRIALPGLETVGWFNGKTDEGEARIVKNIGFGGDGNSLISFMKEWTTAHVGTTVNVSRKYKTPDFD